MRNAPGSGYARMTDSPWFWIYLFSTAGLALLIVFGPKLYSRQAQIEREFQARQRAGQVVGSSGTGPTQSLSTAQNTIISFRPILIMLGILVATGWVGFYVGHLRRRRADQTSTADGHSPS